MSLIFRSLLRIYAYTRRDNVSRRAVWCNVCGINSFSTITSYLRGQVNPPDILFERLITYFRNRVEGDRQILVELELERERVRLYRLNNAPIVKARATRLANKAARQLVGLE